MTIVFDECWTMTLKHAVSLESSSRSVRPTPRRLYEPFEFGPHYSPMH